MRFRGIGLMLFILILIILAFVFARRMRLRARLSLFEQNVAGLNVVTPIQTPLTAKTEAGPERELTAAAQNGLYASLSSTPPIKFAQGNPDPDSAAGAYGRVVTFGRISAPGEFLSLRTAL